LNPSERNPDVCLLVAVNHQFQYQSAIAVNKHKISVVNDNKDLASIGPQVGWSGFHELSWAAPTEVEFRYSSHSHPP
jgi:hypothetical protein